MQDEIMFHSQGLGKIISTSRKGNFFQNITVHIFIQNDSSERSGIDLITAKQPYESPCYPALIKTVPKENNHVRLSGDQKDQWGIPLLITSLDYDDNDEKLLKDFLTQTAEMFENAGVKDIEQEDTKQAPG